MDKIKDNIEEYITTIKRANKEEPKKLLLKKLLVTLFGNNPESNEIINEMLLGAEKSIRNINLKNRIKTGSADSSYGSVIIEFENDLRKTGAHAEYQLQEYVSGRINSGDINDFTLIASDCLTWKVYAPSFEYIEGKNNYTPEDIELKDISTFILDNSNTEDFYFFMDRYLFHSETMKATLESIQNDFGDTSQTFIFCNNIMRSLFNDVKEDGEVKVAYEQWNKFLSIAYGSFNGSEEVFLVHTYLSIFAKILAYLFISNKNTITEKEMQGILNGTIFDSLNLQGFIDNDFFHWVSSTSNFKSLKLVFQKLCQQISRYDFNNVNEDILKGVYQELIDLETRHALGEYYTPDWLCDRVVQRCNFRKDSKVLDPACGSGSFLRAAIAKFKRDFPAITAEELSNLVFGIDIHPLSVQIAKTTLLLSIGDLIRKAKKPVQLKVYLANTLLAPEGTVDLFGSNYTLKIDREDYVVSTTVFENAGLFDSAINICDEFAEFSKGQKVEEIQTFQKQLNIKKVIGITDEMVESFYKIYLGFKSVKENNRDTIWKFILQNLYKPFFLRERFDFVLGNPPWFTYSDVRNIEYQRLLRALADKYKLIPEKEANFPHLEIAAIFLAHSNSYFLKEKGEVCFVLPRAFLSAEQHDNTRSGKASGFKIKEIWDLEKVSPIFRVPSCVLITEKSAKESNEILKKGIAGNSVTGRLKSNNLSWDQVKNILSFEPQTFYYSKLNKRSAMTTHKVKETNKINFYKKFFRQGATIVPRNFYFTEITQEYQDDIKDRYLTVKTSSEVNIEAKKPWKGINIEGRIHSSFLFYTALAKNIVPFYIIDPLLVLLPISIDENKFIKLLSPEDIKDLGYLETATWFKQVKEFWDERRTENNKNISAQDYLNWQNKLISQDVSKKYIVLYNSSAKDANAAIVTRSDFNLEFLVDHKAYFFATNNFEEAVFITCFLNSKIPNEKIKSFQSRGLFGPRDIHKKILEVPFPEYDPKNDLHLELIKIGKNCISKIRPFIANRDDKKISLGRLRLEVKKQIKDDLICIDKIVKKLVN